MCFPLPPSSLQAPGMILKTHISATWFLFATVVGASLAWSENPERQWYKGNTHTHSLWSDGNDFPDMITAWYVEAGYDFLALSDHNILSRDEKWIDTRAIQKRRYTLGKSTLDKYLAHFGEDWVETRGQGEELEVRLKTLEEVRERFEKPGEFILIEAEEITDSFEEKPVPAPLAEGEQPSGTEEGKSATATEGRKIQIHLNALNLEELIEPQKGDSVRATMRNNLLAVKAQEERTSTPMLTHLNHPNFQWSITAEDLAHVVEEDFFEVYNGHPSINHLGNDSTPGDERIWDIANTLRLTKLQSRPLYGLATDDSHQYHGGDVSPGRGWVMVHAEALEADALILAMREGAFYASTGVTLKELNYSRDAQAVEFLIEAKPETHYTTEIFGTRRSTPEQIGKVLARIEGARVHYPLKGDELYVRATVTASKPHPNPSYPNQREQAWTQPIGW